MLFARHTMSKNRTLWILQLLILTAITRSRSRGRSQILYCRAFYSFTITLFGISTKFCPFVIVPDSNFPRIIVPISLYFSAIGNRTGPEFDL